MNENWEIALFGLVATAIAGLVTAGTAMFFLLGNRITSLEVAQNFLTDALGMKAARILHSPDNHLGIDYYLDRYIQGHHDMSYREWMDLHEAMMETVNNPIATKNEKSQARFLAELAIHKTMIKPVAKPTPKPIVGT